MASSSTLHVINMNLLPSAQHLSSFGSNYSIGSIKWGVRREGQMGSQQRGGQAFRVLANPDVSPGKDNKRKEVIMVDPLEAKKLAKKQMEQIKSKERFMKRRRIEAINGAWAMIGLTAGLVIEGHTGQNILSQLAGYWAALIGIFTS
ncbi:hypothetical protein LIER_01759 [Lithospermum erythrorhizon]|uniref:Uncharacterized protein n=1 Tax=Lithospermum erythrorhizon TaxID=34254 RepID=A0AAV3NRP5_LITER